MERNQAKREGRKTWKALQLQSEFRSKLQRTKAERAGLYRVIGGDSAQRPYLRVAHHRYLEVRQMVSARLAGEKRGRTTLHSEALRTTLQLQIEEQTYDVLAREVVTSRSASALLQSLSPEERRHLATLESPPAPPVRQSRTIEDVLGRITAAQKENPQRLHLAWSRAVGSEVAAQSTLERIDPAQATAYFRCYNSALSFQLQRQPGLALKLGRELGLKLKQVRVLY